MIELNEEYELDWLDFCLNRPELIDVLPVEIYNKFFDYLLQENRCDDVFKLTQIMVKVKDCSVEDLPKIKIFDPTWTVEEVRNNIRFLLQIEDRFTDEQWSDILHLTHYIIPVEILVNYGPKLKNMLERRAKLYCKERNIDLFDYDGCLPFRMFRVSLD